MDLYVNFYGLKHNFEKVWGCLYKITWASKFLELMNNFSIEKSMKQVHESWTGSTAADARVHGLSLNESRRLLDLWP
jgi:hypothetical protein